MRTNVQFAAIWERRGGFVTRGTPPWSGAIGSRPADQVRRDHDSAISSSLYTEEIVKSIRPGVRRRRAGSARKRLRR
jgi:hypothetical protein